MKKSFIISIVSIFFLNQFALASNSDAFLVKKLVRNQLIAKFDSLSEGEKEKIESSIFDGLNKIEEKVLTMSDAEVSFAMNEASSNFFNNDTQEEALKVVNKLNENEKNEIVSTISEEDMLIANSSDEALSNVISAELKKSNIDIAYKLKHLTKSEIVKKVIESKEKLKEKISIGHGLLVIGILAAVAVLGLGLGLLIPGIIGGSAVLIGFGGAILGVLVIGGGALLAFVTN